MDPLEVMVVRTHKNYIDKVSKSAKKYKVPESYLLALISLECSGKKIIPKRFEPGVYKKLKSLKNGELKQFEKVQKSDLISLEDNQIRSLSSSWGPFQLMGYKIFELDMSVEDIKGQKAIDVGVLWVRENYGDYLDAKRFKDAFHIHNAGKPHPLKGPPKTYDPNYVPRGIELMNAFEEYLSLE